MPTRSATQTAKTGAGRRSAEYQETSDLHARIALRAYQIYEDSGRTHGHDLDNWLQAEQEVLSETIGTDFA
jgi:hypothetical protein